MNNLNVQIDDENLKSAKDSKKIEKMIKDEDKKAQELAKKKSEKKKDTKKKKSKKD